VKAFSGINEHGTPTHGSFRQLFKDGKVACEGEFVHGRKAGLWTYFVANGQVKAIGSYRDDIIVGDWRWYRENGELMQTGSFSEDGEKHGRWCRYHPTGKLMDEGHYEVGKRAGLCKTYDEGGTQTGAREFSRK
jgi:antitoxin component YwqK of YwqJK toxin-antitoxin module